jgi:Transglycosylase SLT domain
MRLLPTIFLVLAPLRAMASSEDACAEAAANAAERHDVPYELMMAVGRVESGRETTLGFMPWPWSINAAGEGAHFDSENDLLATAQKLAEAGQNNFDLGCFQINYGWHGQEFASLEAMIDPETNADYAAAFLRKLYDSKGDWMLAAGAYHSETPEKAEIYLAKIAEVMGRPVDAPEVAATTEGGLTKAEPDWFLKADMPAVSALGSLVRLTCSTCAQLP